MDKSQWAAPQVHEVDLRKEKAWREARETCFRHQQHCRNSAFVFGPISLLLLPSANRKGSVGRSDKEGSEVVQLVLPVPLLVTGLQAAPRNGTGLFAFPCHLLQPLFGRSSCHKLSDFLIRMTRNTVFVRYFCAHGTVCMGSEVGLCSVPGFVPDSLVCFGVTGILPVCCNIEITPVFSVSFPFFPFVPLSLSSCWKGNNWSLQMCCKE